jgi:hypothetical protein
LAGLAVLVAVGLFALWPQPNRITRENCARINKGMTQAEVVAILGPPGDYTSGPMLLEDEEWPEDDCYRGFAAFSEGPAWCGDTGCVEVRVDNSGEVLACRFVGGRRVEQSALANLLWRAKRQWRRWFPE